MEELGFRFWVWLAAVIVGGAVALLIVLLLFSKAVYAFGFFGAFVALAVVLLLIGWIYDRRQQQKYEEDE
jgi:membrane protein implicated in regulation of membrane protease activity